ncbi:unnamed protein product [Miscanthus lutarioriparius]|uniref:Uncharacterized protein n=1 Tax=Miscanthus lutarioriparius TaxID=422564 RepID=A0A811SJT6_9POAL|nr:unnamed protein product [Miscanthus lutarioriparius]
MALQDRISEEAREGEVSHVTPAVPYEPSPPMRAPWCCWTASLGRQWRAKVSRVPLGSSICRWRCRAKVLVRARIGAPEAHHMLDGMPVTDLELCIRLQFHDCIPSL